MIKFENGLLNRDSLSTIKQRMANEFYSIWGKMINLAQNTADGQEIGVRSQHEYDTDDMIIKLYNTNKLDSAEDVDLDSLVYSNSLTKRKLGSPIIIDITVTTSRDNVTLNGRDGTGTPFTVSDSAGNNFELESTVTITPAGDHSLAFISQEVGDKVIAPNTVTTIVTYVVGVDSVTNASIPRVKGTNRENDAQLRQRYKFNISAPSQGYIAGLNASMLALDGVVAVTTYENDTNSVDSNGIPAKSIYCIIQGGNKDDIGQVFLYKKGAGCGTFGKEKVEIKLNNKDIKEYFFGRPKTVNMTVKVDLKLGDEKKSLIEEKLLEVSYNLAEIAKVQDYYDAIANIDGVIVNSIQISRDGSTFVNILEPQLIEELFITNKVEFA